MSKEELVTFINEHGEGVRLTEDVGLSQNPAYHHYMVGLFAPHMAHMAAMLTITAMQVAGISGAAAGDAWAKRVAERVQAMISEEGHIIDNGKEK